MPFAPRRRAVVGRLVVLAACLALSWTAPARAQVIEPASRQASEVLDMIGERRKEPGNEKQIEGLRAEIRAAQRDNAAAYRLVDLHQQILRLGADDPASWIGLAKAYMGNGQALEGAGAAWLAYQKASTTSEKAEALATVGAALEKADDQKSALEAYRQSLALADAPDVRQRMADVEERLRLHVVAAEAENEADTPSICLSFNQPLPKGAAPSWQDYVKIEPAFDAAFRVADQRLCAGGAEFGQSYLVTALAGLPSATGDKLARTEENTVTVGDRSPSLGFRGNAYILPKVGSAGVPLVSVNVDNAKLALYRVNDRNIVQAIVNGNFLAGVNQWSASNLGDHLGEKVWQGEVDIPLEKNKRVVTALPIEEMRKQAAPGVYVLTAASNAEERDRWEDMATQWVVVTDIGLSTLSGRDGLNVFARSLETGHAIAGIDLRLYGRNNDELGRARTDENGAARFDPGLMRGKDGRAPQALMAYADGGNFAFLDLGRPAFDLSDRGVGGRPAAGGLDAYVYADRGVYRPGETAHLVGLVRDPSGKAVEGVPITLRLMRPDGVEASRQLLAPGGQGAYEMTLPISAAARTGTWTAQLHTDPDGPPVGSASFLVEDVVPARIEANLSSPAKVLAPGQKAEIEVAAKYLFGAPAADLRAAGEVVVKPSADPFPDRPGYSFGLVDEDVPATRVALDDATTDKDGKARFEAPLPDLPSSNKPLSATLRVDVYEPGGRAVIRTLDVPVARSGLVLGIKPAFAGDQVPDGAQAGFDVIAVGPDGKQVDAKGLTWVLVEEDWYYQWYRRSTVWDYEVQIRDRRVTGGTVDAVADRPARVDVAVPYGRYRLEVVTADGAVASSVRFHSGWQVSPGLGDTPDKLEVVADKPLYHAGETAKLALKAPFAGETQVVIATDRVIETRNVTVPAEGTTIDVPVSGDWGAGAYVLATAFRPGEDASAKGPGRAIGIAWLGLDPGERSLAVSLGAPAESLPRREVEVPVSVTGALPGEKTFVTLAAVDEGVLQLTDFHAPAPVDYFFGKRRLGVEIRDAYGQLIDGKAGKPGKLREGGDEGGLARRGAPPPTIKIVSLFSGVVALDDQGKGTVKLALPDYNGRLRLMAVAWSASKVGAAEAPLVVRDPVVVLSSTPRFLGTGDRSRLTLTLANAAGAAGDYAVKLEASGPVTLGEGAASLKRTLANGASADIEVPIRGTGVGLGRIAVNVSGPDGSALDRVIELGVRPPQLPEIDRQSRELKPGESTIADGKLVARYLPGSADAALSLSPTPNLDVAGLLRSLDRYPYGCVEQTISRAMPLLYFDQVASLWNQERDPPVRSRVIRAIGRVAEMQRANGGITLWGDEGQPDPWLSAYAVDFLTRARALDLPVPDFAFRRGVSWLKAMVDNRRDDTPDALEARAYAAYALAAAGAGDLSATRYLNDAMGDRFETPLPSAHLGAAFMLLGDTERARAAFARAFARIDAMKDDKKAWRWYGRSYGTDLRDLAATIALAAETKAPGIDLSAYVTLLRQRHLTRRWLSTQEEGALLMAARALSSTDTPMEVSISNQPQAPRTQPLDLKATPDDLAKGLMLANTGKGTVWLTSTAMGVPEQDLPAESNGFAVQRSFFTPDGEAANLKAVPQGAVLVAVVVGKASDTDERHQALVVDMLPAGFEIENPRLAGSRMVNEMPWLPKLSLTSYTDALDDRFVAALDVVGDQRDFAVAYLVRAVTPGQYRVPAVAVEDMYAPELRARGAMGTVTIAPVN
jgi:uncharacterized protein YfaS (alpha-2-macroglobulin family)